MRDDIKFKASDIYVFEYCTKNTCNNAGECVLTSGSASCQCKAGYHGNRCVPISYPDKDYYVIGGLCGTIFALVVVLLVVFCRTYTFPYRKQHGSTKSHSSSVTGRTGMSSNISYLKRGSSNQGTYLNRAGKDACFPTYKEMDGVIPLHGKISNGGVQNKAFVIDNNSHEDNHSDNIYKKQLKKFFDEAPQMRLNNTIINTSRSNSLNGNEAMTVAKKKKNSGMENKHESSTTLNSARNSVKMNNHEVNKASSKKPFTNAET